MSERRKTQSPWTVGLACAVGTASLLHGENAEAYFEEVAPQACRNINATTRICPYLDNAVYRFDQSTRARAYIKQNVAAGVTAAACFTASNQFGTFCGSPKSRTQLGWTTLDMSLSQWMSGVSGFPYVKVVVTDGFFSGLTVSYP